MRAAIINTQTGLVENVIIAAANFVPTEGEIHALPSDSSVGIGWTWTGTEFLPPEPEPGGDPT